MAEQNLIFAAMKEELGNQRVDTLPLDNSSRRPSYQPRRTRVIRTAAIMKMASGWKNAIQSGAFNDSDSRPIQGLEDMGGPRLYDTLNARRSSVRPPPFPDGPEPQVSDARQPSHRPVPIVRLPPPSATDSGPRAAHGPDTPRPSIGMLDRPSVAAPNAQAAHGPGTPHPSIRMPDRPSAAGPNAQAAHDTGTPHPLVPVPSHQVNVPPTPGPSPTTATAGSSSEAPTRPQAATPAAVTHPKSSRGLGSSRWATGADNSKPSMGNDSQVSIPDVKKPEVTNFEVLRQEPAQGGQIQAEKQASSPAINQQVSFDDQATFQSSSHGDMVEQATQGLADLKITDMDPPHLAGKYVFSDAKAWLLDRGPLGNKICTLYLIEGDHDDAVFRVDFNSKARESHDLLNLLSYTRSGTLLDLAFRSVANDITGYSFEFETEKRLKEFVEVMEGLRDLTVQILWEELNDLKSASTPTMIRKQKAKGVSIAHSIGLTTVTYAFPTPDRREVSLKPEVKRASTTQEFSSPFAEAETPTPKRQRMMYSVEGLERLRNASIIPRGMDTDFIQSVKQATHKKTDSQECVVGVDESLSSQERVERRVEGRLSRDEGGDDSSTVLGEVHRSVSKNKAWLFKSGTGL